MLEDGYPLMAILIRSTGDVDRDYRCALPGLVFWEIDEGLCVSALLMVLLDMVFCRLVCESLVGNAGNLF